MFDPLYQQLLLDHAKKPCNFGRLEAAPVRRRHDNPACGDRLELQFAGVAQGTIRDFRFDGHGCVLCLASASLIGEAVKGKPVVAVRAISSNFFAMIAGAGAIAPDLGALAAFAAVKRAPGRTKCVTLAWEALKSRMLLPRAHGLGAERLISRCRSISM